jgi:RecA-family ATPase
MSFGELDNPILDILYGDVAEPEWMIPGLLIRGTVVCLAGEPGTGKSILNYGLGLAMATGVPALSGVVKAGKPQRVLYFDQENSRPDRDGYLRWAWNGLVHSHGEEPDVALLEENFLPVYKQLGTPHWPDKAEHYIERFQPTLIIFDTAISAFALEDENDNAEASRVINHLYSLAAVPTAGEASIIVLRHASPRQDKKHARKMRGATVWKSQVDQTIFQVRVPGRPRKNGLALTRLEPDKKRRYGLSDTIYITPSFTDAAKTGLVLEGSYEPSREHKAKLHEEEGDDED